MYNKVFKNYQINLGTPYQIKAPVSFDSLKKSEVDLTAISELVVNDTDILLQDAEAEAFKIVAAAQEQAERIKHEAELEIRQHAQLEYQRAYASGEADARKRYDSLLEETASIRNEIRAEYEKVLAGIEADIINLVLEISRKVIGCELESNKDALISLAAQAVNRCSDKKGLVLKVSEEAFDSTAETENKLKGMTGVEDITIKNDPSLQAGGCIVETCFGAVDASFETKMKRIEELFRELSGSTNIRR